MANRSQDQKKINVSLIKQDMARKDWNQKMLAREAKLSERTIQAMLETGTATLKTTVAVAERALGLRPWEDYLTPEASAIAAPSAKEEPLTYQQLWNGPGSLAHKLKETARLYPSRSPLARSQLMAIKQDVTIRIEPNGDGHVRYAFKIANVGSQPIRGTSRHLWFAHPQDTSRMNLRGQWNDHENVKIIMETDLERNKQFFVAFPRELKPFATCRFHYEFDVHQEYIPNVPPSPGSHGINIQDLPAWDISLVQNSFSPISFWTGCEQSDPPTAE
jgi:hypothetical protein